MYHQSYPQPPPRPSYGGSNSSHYGGGSYGSQPPSYQNPSHTQSPTNSSSSTAGQGDNSLMARMDERSAFSLLHHLGKEELQHLHDNDDKLQDLVNDLAQVRGIQEEHDNLIASNKSIAEYNLSLQPRLEDLKRTVAEGYERQNTLKTSLAQSKATLDSFVNQQSLETLLALLQTETAKAEEDSENLTSEFYDSAVEMEEFVNQFLTKRTVMHLRRVKSERMAELVRGQHGGAGVPSHHHAMPNSVGSAPYPTGGAFNMPQPQLPYR